MWHGDRGEAHPLAERCANDGCGIIDHDIVEVEGLGRCGQSPREGHHRLFALLMASFVAVSLLLSAGLFILPGPAEGPRTAEPKAYVVHAAIVISSDSDFAAQGWPGSGGAGNPYVISGLEIDGLGFQCGIFISNTTKYYVIQGCYIYSSWPAGVFLHSAPNGELLDCVVSDSDPFGIRVSSCSSISIVNNTCTGSAGTGISVYQTPGVLIADNTCQGNGEHGINLSSSDGSTVSGNVCTGNSNNGIYSQGSSIDILDNSCNDNQREGIRAYAGTGLTVAGNHCGYDELLLESVSYSNISRNVLVGSAVRLWASSHNDINNNTCSNPGSSGIILTESGSMGSSPENLIADNNCSGCFRGMSVSGATTIVRNDCTNCTTGVYMETADYSVVIENDCSGSDVGIELELTDYTTISGNLISPASTAAMIIRQSTYATLRDNQMVSCGVSIEGSTAPEWALHDIDVSNTVNGLPLFYAKGVLSGQVTSGYGQVIVAASKNVEVRGQSIDNASTGIALGFCTNVTVADSQCANNSLQGILFDHSEGCSAVNNSCPLNKDGIKLQASESCLASNNTCDRNAQSGIVVLGDSSNSYYGNNTLKNNSCSYNLDGILVQWSQYNQVCYNLLTWNTRYGVFLASPSPWRMPFPIYTQFNLVFGNTFMANNGGGVQALDTGDYNWWNLTASGNYWDDLQTPDANGDGIVDVPYAVGGGSYDYYPLTSYPPSPIPELPTAGMVGVIVVTGLLICVWTRRRR